MLQHPPSNDRTSDLNPHAAAQELSESDRKVVPADRTTRNTIHSTCTARVAEMDKTGGLGRVEMESLARDILRDLGQPEKYLGWTMVAFTSEYWREQVAAVPPTRRLLLLPHCLRDDDACPAPTDADGLHCSRCGRCEIDTLMHEAKEAGYSVLVAEGSPAAMKAIISGKIDAIIGVACLDVLERVIDSILSVGVPCMAVPLLTGGCRNTTIDRDWVEQMIHLDQCSTEQRSRTYVHLMRMASDLFKPAALASLAPRRHGNQPETLAALSSDKPSTNGAANVSPLDMTETVAYDFLARGGKYARPFITLAAYDAISGGQAFDPDKGQDAVAAIPDAVRRAAVSIEAFHKASLVHDDIEDDDEFRYGEPTIHRTHGIPAAINIGDYLIGIGYRLATHDAATIGGDTVADMVTILSDAHTKLALGQGAELAWRDAFDKRLSPLDALRIYSLKTSPAFEAALLVGARLAGSVQQYEEPMRRFAHNLGVAFQILNDLGDWKGDDNNKLHVGGDLIGGRPTILWAFAVERLSTENLEKLEGLLSTDAGYSDHEILSRARVLFHEADAFSSAAMLVEKYRARAEQTCESPESETLKRLFRYLIAVLLDQCGCATEAGKVAPVDEMPIAEQSTNQLG